MEKSREEFLRTKAYPFYEAVCGLLRLMTEARAHPAGMEPKPLYLSECRIKGEGYDIRFVLRNKGIRPFLAFMDEPWPHKVYLGRLTKHGLPHPFVEGVKVFFNFLLMEEVLDPFLADLAAIVAEWSAMSPPRPSSCPFASLADCAQGCAQGCGAEGADGTGGWKPLGGDGPMPGERGPARAKTEKDAGRDADAGGTLH
ncbi:hypothetical protein dsx2_2360 [Desulfovibrio sp. X2]|uniref:hypothetical protein n=1 Tax=Desulfovibrio sp. X2 TaxID=941449 RepID=UPI00035884A5|nr:hypothetical protein [Desulfovibrio sp. X2]EPR43509.1 hypothetical protein dsx2_2360 [Desulfovibrio sp. X2]